jgi:hypothetical protein
MTGQEARPSELDTMANVFAVAGEKTKTITARATIALPKRFAGDPVIGKATVAEPALTGVTQELTYSPTHFLGVYLSAEVSITC